MMNDKHNVMQVVVCVAVERWWFQPTKSTYIGPG